MMEKGQQGWRSRWLSFRNATVVVCSFNLLLVLFLIHSFLSASSIAKLTTSHQTSSVLLTHIRESEEIRRAMVPVDLIRRVRDIERESFVETQEVQQKDTKQTAAVDVVSRLNNFRSYSDGGGLKAVEEWRKRKMERARQRGLGKNGTIVL